MVTIEDEDEAALPAVVGAAASTDATPGPDFFRTQLADRVRARCSDEADVPVVQLRLADGTTLDVCHIPTIERLWLAVEAFRDPETCEDMDLVFIPYETVTRVTVSARPQRERPIGFRMVG